MANTEISLGTGVAARLWCDDRTRECILDPKVAQVASERFDALYDDLELAWGVIANAYGGDWEKAHPEWREAAERWRDKYQELIKSDE